MRIQDAIKAAVLFGIPMGAFFSLKSGLIVGGIAGGVSGLCFGISLLVFVNNPIIQRQMSITEDQLLPDEEIIFSEPANLLVVLEEVGLSDFAFDDLFWLVGMKGKESMGGKLYLTNYRFIFKSHRFNRMRGVISIFLPTVQSLKDTSHSIVQKITVQSVTSQVGFVVYKPDRWVQRFSQQQELLNQESIEKIIQLATAHPEKVSDTFATWEALNAVNNALLFGSKSKEAVKLISNPIGALGGLFLRELLDQTIVDRWNQRFEKTEEE